MNDLFAKVTESLNDSDEISRESNTCVCAYGSLSKGDAYEDLRSTTPKGVKVVCLHTCEHVCLGNSKNKMLSFLFLESDFSNRRLLLHYTKSQYNSPISDEENIYMTNSISTEEIQAGWKYAKWLGFTIEQFAELESERLGVSTDLICESLLGGPSPTKQE
tara:strand:+ start:3107 stop:3589 length:483 start_codon:yes stop_codon:yes gene_type:complete